MVIALVDPMPHYRIGMSLLYLQALERLATCNHWILAIETQPMVKP